MTVTGVLLQYENLDEEHKGLFKGVFAVAEKPGCGDTLAALADCVKKHFATEEVSIYFQYSSRNLYYFSIC